MKKLAALALLLVASNVSAAEEAGPVAVAETSSSRVFWFLPELKVSANTTGSAEFSVRGSAAIATGPNSDLLFWPIAKVQTADGFARLLNVDSQSDTQTVDTVPWRLGIAFGYMSFDESPATPVAEVYARKKKADLQCRKGCVAGQDDYCKRIAPALAETKKPAEAVDIEQYCAKGKQAYADEDKKQLAGAGKFCGTPDVTADKLCTEGREAYKSALKVARQDAFNLCWSAECTGVEEKGFCTLASTRPVYQSVDNALFCDEGKEILKKPFRPDEASLLPPFTISAGATFGQDGFKYYDHPASDQTLLEKGDSRRWGIKAGVAASQVFSRWSTLEWGAFYERKASAASDSLHWCTPKGNVAHTGTTYDPLNPSTFDAAATCNDTIVGAPSTSNSLALFAEYGLTGPKGEGWRIAFGPHFKVAKQPGQDVQVSSLSFGIPLYLDLQTLPKDYGAYRAVVRLTPAIETYRDKDNGLQRRFMLTLDLLAQRTLFASVADLL